MDSNLFSLNRRAFKEFYFLGSFCNGVKNFNSAENRVKCVPKKGNDGNCVWKVNVPYNILVGIPVCASHQFTHNIVDMRGDKFDVECFLDHFNFSNNYFMDWCFVVVVQKCWRHSKHNSLHVNIPSVRLKTIVNEEVIKLRRTLSCSLSDCIRLL